MYIGTCHGGRRHREGAEHLARQDFPDDDGLVSLLEVAGHDVGLTGRELHHLKVCWAVREKLDESNVIRRR